MNAILLFTLLAGPIGDISVVTPREARCYLADRVQTGSLIFSRGDCLAVKVYSCSRLTHVVSVVVHDSGIYCYDSTGGAGVRKQSLADYLESQKDAELHPFHPHKPLTKKQAAQFEAHLESQLGRPYAVTHHLTGQRANGLHCSEYATDALIGCGLLTANEPSRVSPASLAEGILKGDLYEEADSLQLAPEPAPLPESDWWCVRLWYSTAQCTVDCCRKMRAWFCCK
ncbi:MAG: hypothetical protein HY290_09320 [Planctomycetia bacterium]|nr:hypothetical protein [Planctomycetia bacterium]